MLDDCQSSRFGLGNYPQLPALPANWLPLGKGDDVRTKMTARSAKFVKFMLEGHPKGKSAELAGYKASDAANNRILSGRLAPARVLRTP